MTSPTHPAPGFLHRGLTHLALLSAALFLAACGSEPDDGSSSTTGPEEEPATGVAAHCAPDDDGLALPDGFCAVVVHEGLGRARHLAVASNGDIVVALADGREEAGGVAVLRDTDGDAQADSVARFGEVGGNDVLLTEAGLWFAADDRILRYPWTEGATTPSGGPVTVVSGLPDIRNHTAKSIALDGSGGLFVNIGSPSNACMEEARTQGSPGMDPCPELETRAGIWRFDAGATGQGPADGTLWATGVRNAVALATTPDGALYGVVHGRDQLHGMFPDRYTVADNTEKPAEEFVRLDEGTDIGWPYCYHDPETGQKLLAPEYGGEGTEVGRCADKDMPIIGFPAHWAPNDLAFYTGSSFPARYQGGAFIAFHGSWNRAPNPQEGFRVVFVPADGTGFGTEWDTFADGFRDPDNPGASDSARPVGLDVGPDGSLYVSDSVRGRIWRIVPEGG